MSERLLKISGKRAETFLQQVVTSDISSLKSGESLSSLLFNRDGILLDAITLKKREKGFLVLCSNAKKMRLVKSWLKELSNGYIIFDEDILAKINGPVIIGGQTSTFDKLHPHLSPGDSLPLRGAGATNKEHRIARLPRCEAWPERIKERGKDIKTIYKEYPELFSLSKPYFVGQKRLKEVVSPHKNHKKRAFFYEEKEGKLKKTPLYPEHLRRGAKISPFAGWEMPIFYTSIIEEHQAVRRTAALFDIGHMGIIEIKGKGATSFLDIVTTNYVWWLKDKESFYSFVLNPDGDVLDDVMIYRKNGKNYLLVCNCINQEKIWNWLNVVNSKQYLIDEDYPQKEIKEKVILRNLSKQSAGKEQKTILALQGPNSLLVLKRIIAEGGLRRLEKLQKREFIETAIAGREVIIACAGYTGEKIGFELFLSSADSGLIWNLLLKEGEGLGVIPAGLGARDSTRTEAGFPLWGKELAGKFNISPIEAGAGFYVKFHKPWFVGREVLLRKKLRKRIISFEMTERAIPREGYPVIFKNKRIGEVTSGTFSPFTEKYIGLAYLNIEYSDV
ncbi:MAG: glycine cleavage system aminomethyltransferase GcvT, partial [Candidatus Omnitrophica bacterium]|nr:glycine cleavage system aminomethyltransferase GcvT [Candidatus Omnitrophota bacterium]